MLSLYTAFSIGSLQGVTVGSAGRLSSADREAVENAMELAQVQDFADRAVDTLSGGEKQRAYLAMVLADGTCVFSGTAEDCLASGMPEKWLGVSRYICTNESRKQIFFR